MTGVPEQSFLFVWFVDYLYGYLPRDPLSFTSAGARPLMAL